MCGVKMPSSREFDVWAAASAPQCVTRAGTFLCDSFGHGFTLTHSPNTEAERATIDTAHTHVTPRCRTVTVTLSDDYADGLYRVLSVVVVVFASQHPIKSPLSSRVPRFLAVGVAPTPTAREVPRGSCLSRADAKAAVEGSPVTVVAAGGPAEPWRSPPPSTPACCHQRRRCSVPLRGVLARDAWRWLVAPLGVA